MSNKNMLNAKTTASEPMKEEDRPSGPHKYEVEDGLRKLTDAEDVKSNKKLMPHVKKLAKKKVKHMTSISQLKDARNKMLRDKGGNPDVSDDDNDGE